MKIFLIGFMGSGKTSIGKKLAKNLGFKFVDLDHHVEEKAGRSINEIFTEMGEEKFRDLEREVLEDLESHSQTVIATGGGTPCFSDNMQFMKTSGTTVYLQLNGKVILERLANAKASRPLIKNLNDDELRLFIEEKLNERSPIYQEAHYNVNAAHISNAVEEIRSLVEQ
ncbi:shikimate kinase [Flavobacteriales bacterium AH-315-E23]|nr:shikimate kinase [Flavobacteriales bacterium AH-315-E23]